MSVRIALAALALAIGLSASGAAASETAPGECEARLARTLAEMEARPLLKEELATGLMWLRLDAETALAAGDVAACLEGVRTVEQILGLESPD
jgi:hypothetical protein